MTSTELSSILGGPRQSSAPDWFRELQAKAWEEFEAEPLPTRGNELWRFSSVKNLALDGYVAASGFLRRYLDFDRVHANFRSRPAESFSPMTPWSSAN